MVTSSVAFSEDGCSSAVGVGGTQKKEEKSQDIPTRNISDFESLQSNEPGDIAWMSHPSVGRERPWCYLACSPFFLVISGVDIRELYVIDIDNVLDPSARYRVHAGNLAQTFTINHLATHQSAPNND